MTLLWHGREPVGVCVFAAPAAALAPRSRFFGLRGPSSRAALAALNDQLWVLQRVVLHPTYRGAGVGAGFVRRACELCPVSWVETLSALGRANPFFERAGFVRAGEVRPHAGGRNGSVGRPTRATGGPARGGEPVYYVFDNRGEARRIDRYGSDQNGET